MSVVAGGFDRAGWLDLALAACDEADLLAMAAYRGSREVSTKTDGTLVTSADREIERLLRERIHAAHPDHGLIGEEYGPEAAERPVRWYLDPIDGTSNFVRGVPIFATLMAVEREGTLDVAVVSAPALRMRWLAWRGGGAWSVAAGGERHRLSVSGIATIPEAHLLYASATALRASGAVPGLDALLAQVWRERGFGDFWGHMLVAEGSAEAMLEFGLAAWDIAAPMLIVQEAGGRCTDLEGRAELHGRGGFLSVNAALHAPLLAALTS
ncbi:histidinol-phosphatase [soil metagenome]